jgi:ABC-type transport system involved in multi-copper enzyme maturation permease subunit
MSKQAVHDKVPDRRPAADWKLPEETAPSLVKPDEPLLPRLIGFVGLLLVTIGGSALLASALKWQRVNVSPGWGIVFFVTGVCALLYHAAVDTDLQWRRTYGTIGFAWLLTGMIASAVPAAPGGVGSLFMPYGFLCFALGLFFLLPFARNEDDPMWRAATVKVLFGSGAMLAVIGLVGGSFQEKFLLAKGLPMALLGLCFLWAFVGQVGTSSEPGYWTGIGIGGAGLLVFLVALGRAIFQPLFHTWGWTANLPGSFLVPQGLVLMGLGLLYLGIAFGLCSESQLVVLTRKELASYFFSPIAYIVLIGIAAAAWLQYLFFVYKVLEWSRQAPPVNFDPLIEPAIGAYAFGLFTVLAIIFVVPVLTMRLFSEERRSGTLEVLFTAPVREGNVVLSKFFAAFLVFMLSWLPLALFLVDLRIEGDRPFDYRPMLSFYLALACTGAGFIGVGLFFSSLTRNQIAAAVLTFMWMAAATALLLVRGFVKDQDGTLSNLIVSVSYLDLWLASLKGLVIPRQLIFHVSLAGFWLFLTTKVLEARKWS